MNRTKRSPQNDPQRRTLALACIVCAVILVGLLVTAGVLTWQFSNRVYPLIRAEAGLPYLDPDVFLTDKALHATFDKGVTAQQLSKPGTYDVILRCEGRTYASQVEVVDTMAPMAVAAAVTSQGELPAPEAFIAQVSDATAVTVTYKTTPDVSVAGEQTVTLLLTDEAGNVTELNAQLTVVAENTPAPDNTENTENTEGTDENQGILPNRP